MRPILVTVTAIAVLGGCAGSAPPDASSVDGTTGGSVTSITTVDSGVATTSVSTADVNAETTAPPDTTADPTAANTATPQQGDEAGLRERFRLHGEWYLGDDPTVAYPIYSTACRDKYSLGEFTLLQRSVHAVLRGIMGFEPTDLHYSDPDIEFAGNTADLTYELLGPDDAPVFADEPIIATWIFENGDWFRETCNWDQALLIDREGAPVLGTRNDPIPLGEGADIGDAWSLKINSVNLDANDVVLAADPNNTAPADGMVYVLVNFTAAYAGFEVSLAGVAISAVGQGTDTVMLGGVAEGVSVTPAPAYDELPMSTGDTTTGNVVIEVPAEDIDTLVLIGQPVDGGVDETPRTFFAAT